MIVALFFLCVLFPLQNDPSHSAADQIATLKKLYTEKRWDEMVQLIPSGSDRPADVDWYLGLAFARLQRWGEAKTAFEAGHAKEPGDKRFLLELAGVAYQLKDFSAAKTHLKTALKIDPSDAYAQNFLATLYFLEDNSEAALQHWNSIGKPQVTAVRWSPEPRVRASLLDRAFTFSPLSVLRLDEFRATQARIENLEIFPRYQLELVPQDDGSFAVSFRSTERNGWGDGALDGLLSLLRGLPYQTIYPEYYNLNRSAFNFLSLLRWDAQKRRAFASFSFPLGDDPRWRFRFYLDGRNENWDIARTFQASFSPISDLKLEKVEAGLEIRSVLNGRLGWRSGVYFDHRAFPRLQGVLPEARPFFTGGFSLKYGAGLDYKILRLPERRITVDSVASAQFGEFLARPLGGFAKFQGSLALHWLPLPRGEDYEMTAQLRAGRTIGLVPFDELFQLGLERDNDLWLRGRIGTRDGKKGNAPLGRNYVLWNWETDKTILRRSFFTVKLGPFVDAGKITDPSRDFVSEGWLWDPGAQCKVRILGSLSIVVSYGRDLRTARNAFYTTVTR